MNIKSIDNISWKANADVCFEDLNKVYFTLWEMNLIGCYDLEYGTVSLIHGPLDEELLERQLYSAISKWKNCLIFTPYYAKNIWKYDLASSNWTKIDISSFLPSDMTAKFATGCVFENKLYMFGRNYSNIMVVDLITNEISIISPADEDNAPKSVQFFAANYVRRDQFVYIMNYRSNYLYKFDLKNASGKWIRIETADPEYIGVIFHDGRFWLVPYNSVSAKVAVWNEQNGSQEVYELSLENIEFFYGCYVMKSDITFYNYISRSLTYNMKKHNCKYGDVEVSAALQLKDKSWLIGETGGVLKHLSGDGECISESKISIDQAEMRQYIKENIKSIKYIDRKIIQENKAYGLELLFCLM